MNSERWPALLTMESACRYLSLETATLLELARRWNVRPVDTGADAPLWRRSDLDRLIRRLPETDRIFGGDDVRSLPLDPQTIEQIACAVARRLEDRATSRGQSAPHLVSIREAAHLLGLGRSTVYAMIHGGKLQVRRLGARTLITRESIEALIAR